LETGDMFPPDKLASAIQRVAADIEQHYGSLLRAEPAAWTEASGIASAPVAKRKLP